MPFVAFFLRDTRMAGVWMKTESRPWESNPLYRGRAFELGSECPSYESPQVRGMIRATFPCKNGSTSWGSYVVQTALPTALRLLRPLGGSTGQVVPSADDVAASGKPTSRLSSAFLLLLLKDMNDLRLSEKKCLDSRLKGGDSSMVRAYYNQTHRGAQFARNTQTISRRANMYLYIDALCSWNIPVICLTGSVDFV